MNFPSRKHLFACNRQKTLINTELFGCWKLFFLTKRFSFGNFHWNFHDFSHFSNTIFPKGKKLTSSFVVTFEWFFNALQLSASATRKAENFEFSLNQSNVEQFLLIDAHLKNHRFSLSRTIYLRSFKLVFIEVYLHRQQSCYKMLHGQ